jgi:hypothetical protein
LGSGSQKLGGGLVRRAVGLFDCLRRRATASLRLDFDPKTFLWSL